jgi:hypothetical protein
LRLPDPQIHYAMSLLRGIGRSHLGDLASFSGETLRSIAHPLALRVSIELEGLERELFEKGDKRHLSRIDNALIDYGLGKPRGNRRSPDFMNISSDDGKILSIGAIKYLATPIGWVSALSEQDGQGILPADESVYLCASQLSARINAILTPGSSTAMEVFCRKLLYALKDKGVAAVAAQAMEKAEASISIFRTVKEIDHRESQPMHTEGDTLPKNGENIAPGTIARIWPEQQIEAGIWIKDLPGHLIALGFSLKKNLTKKTKNEISAVIGDLTARDTDYIVEAFERLKTDFKKLVKTERTAAISETAVTVNHEINNPLTAILGNTQLLLMGREKLSGDVVAKLETIEKSAIQIRETTAKLMSIIEPVKSSYSTGMDMIDIEKSKKKKSS